MKKLSLLFLLLIFICSCDVATDKNKSEVGSYFNIKGYFNKEIARLTKKGQSIQKTVGVNGSMETKTMNIGDWEKELSAFSNAEINRASWRGLFVTTKKDNVVIYTSNDEKVPVKEVKLFMNDGIIKGLSIVIRNENILYDSTDSLAYFPDSIYQVKKQQNIRFLSKKNYVIEGRFN